MTGPEHLDTMAGPEHLGAALGDERVGALNGTGPARRIVLVCSANRCRSPMAAALLGARLREHGLRATVESAGFGPSGLPVVPGARAAMAEVGLDLGDQVSEQVSTTSCVDATLIVGMTRQHIIELVLLSPSTWPRTFTLTDLVRRGHQLGSRRVEESVETWVSRAHGGRQRSSVLSLPLTDDIADPTGGTAAAFTRTRRELSRLVDDLAALLAPATAKSG